MTLRLSVCNWDPSTSLGMTEVVGRLCQTPPGNWRFTETPYNFDHPSEKWETLKPDGTKMHFGFELTRKGR